MMANSHRYGRFISGIVPIRSDAGDPAEMVSQGLLGETFRILEETERWYRIELMFDGYLGWISKGQACETDASDHIAWTHHPERKPSPFHTYRVSNGHETLLVPTGAAVITTAAGIELPQGAYERITPRHSILEHSLLDTALNFQGASYLWGGRTDSGIDCSGFVQAVFSLHGYSLPRDAWQQHDFAELKSRSLDDAEAGDLLYFSYADGKIHHVGFYMGDGYALHASGNVTIHTVDPAKRTTGRYSFNERLATSLVGVQSALSLKAAASKKRTL
jgi:cell wall-associated NlpC family hydrolase